MRAKFLIIFLLILSACSVFEKKEYTCDKDILSFEKAVKKGNAVECNFIFFEPLRKYCNELIIQNINESNAKIANFYSDCFLNLSKEGNFSDCSKLSQREYGNRILSEYGALFECETNNAIYRNNFENCFRMESLDERDSCIYKVSMENNNLNGCHMISNKTDTYYLEGPGNIHGYGRDFLNDLCFVNLLNLTKSTDITDCNFLVKKIPCYQDVATNTNNITYCMMIGDNKIMSGYGEIRVSKQLCLTKLKDYPTEELCEMMRNDFVGTNVPTKNDCLSDLSNKKYEK